MVARYICSKFKHCGVCMALHCGKLSSGENETGKG